MSLPIRLEAKADRSQQASVPNTLQAFQVQSKYRDYSSYLRAFKTPWVNACASLIAYYFASNTKQLIDTTNDDEPVVDPNNPLLQLLAQPNPVQDGFSFWELAELYLELTGNVYITLEERDAYGRPREMYLPNPANMRVIPDPVNYVKGYVYDVNGSTSGLGLPGQILVPYDADEVIHIKLPNPTDTYYGMGNIEAMTMLLDTKDAMDRTEFAYWRSGGKITGVLETDDYLSNEEFDRLKREWQASNRDDQNRIRTAILSKGLHYTPIAEGMKNLDLVNLDKGKRDTILAVWGVPGPKIGILENAQYKAEDADETFETETMEPKFKRWEVGLQPLVDLYEPDWTLQYERRNFEDDTDKLTNAGLMLAAGFTLDEVRVYVGAEPLPNKAGEVLVLSNLLVITPLADFGAIADANADAILNPPAPPAPVAPASPETPGEGAPVGKPVLKLLDMKSVITPEERAQMERDAWVREVRAAAVKRGIGTKAAPSPFQRVRAHRPVIETKAVVPGHALVADKARLWGAQKVRAKRLVAEGMRAFLAPALSAAAVAKLLAIKDADERRAAVATLLEDQSPLAAALGTVRGTGFTAGAASSSRVVGTKASLGLAAPTLPGSGHLDPEVAKRLPLMAARLRSVSTIADTQIDAISDVVTKTIEVGGTALDAVNGNADLGVTSSLMDVMQGATDWQAERVARTEMSTAYNAGSLSSYAQASVPSTLVYDGDVDEMCASRDGQTVDLETADEWADSEHPNGTITFAPSYDSATTSSADTADGSSG
jgi:HK97 family phage portal protein